MRFIHFSVLLITSCSTKPKASFFRRNSSLRASQEIEAALGDMRKLTEGSIPWMTGQQAPRDQEAALSEMRKLTEGIFGL
ncbi:MAG: hypothetical protein M5R42_12075 [Rhodocyclaceae bacterium]|nr:hypothetical protein [Rhodocyclaceae bacterium]